MPRRTRTFSPNSAHSSKDDLLKSDMPRWNPYEPIFLWSWPHSNSDLESRANPSLYFECIHHSTEKHRPFATYACFYLCYFQDLAVSGKSIFITTSVTVVDFEGAEFPWHSSHYAYLHRYLPRPPFIHILHGGSFEVQLMKSFLNHSNNGLSLSSSFSCNICSGTRDPIFSRISRSWHCSLMPLYNKKTFFIVSFQLQYRGIFPWLKIFVNVFWSRTPICMTQ